MSEPEISSLLVEQSAQTIEVQVAEQEQWVAKERLILEEFIENIEDKTKVLLRYQAVMEITQASGSLRKEKIKLWADRLEVCERSVTRLLEKVEKEGVAALAKLTRPDAGVARGSEHWKGKTVEEWIEFIWKTYTVLT